MSEVLDPIGPAPEAGEPRVLWLLAGCAAAPLFWLGQMMLAYGVSAYVCYPGDHPVTLASPGTLISALWLFDLIALAACLFGAWISWRGWRSVRHGRNRFLALGGIMFSLWFFAAVIFNVIASSWVPPCLV